MAPVDRFLSDIGVRSARYVDDLYVFVESVDAADKLMRDLVPFLRSYDLTLNESKSSILPKNLLATMEPDLETSFQQAVEEASTLFSDEDFDAGYGFQAKWEEEEEDLEIESEDDAKYSDAELTATIHLFDSIDRYPGQEENVERFCLPLFAKAGSSYAVNHVMDSFRKRPAMAQIYSAYLSNFLTDPEVNNFFGLFLEDDLLHDWQKMWILAALLQGERLEDAQVKQVFDVLRDGNRHEALRAVAGYYVERFGDNTRRNGLRGIYMQQTPHIQAAIYASSRFWPGVEASNARATWGANGLMNQLLTHAMAKK